MTTLTFRSPVTKPLLRKGTPKPAPPDPRAYESFRVTQQFSDRDFYHNDGRLHNATDIGNYRCNDPIVAMAAGTAYRAKDSAGALGIRIDHGYGVSSEYWHLNGYSVADGTAIVAGQKVGIVGSTGLGSVCHCHIEVKRGSTRIDPEPLMFGGSLTIEEDDVNIPAGLQPIAQAVLGPGNRLRDAALTTEGSRVIGAPPPIGIGEAKAYWVQVYGFGVPGEAYTLGGKAGSAYGWVGVFGRTWYVAEPLLTQLTASARVTPPPADCSAEEATIAQLNGKIDRARTANRGATQAQQAVEGALA